jgi:hypothetical protein
MRYATSLGRGRLLAVISGLILAFAVPAAAQYNIYDLGENVATHDIRTDNSGGVHVVWTVSGILYYGRIVNNAITGKVEVTRGLSTTFWRPYLSVRPDGSSAHVLWNNMAGLILSHSWRDSSGWHTETVQTVPTTQWISQATCAVDGTGMVHAMFAVWNKSTGTNAIYYKRRLVSGQWEATQAFTAGVPEHKFPVMVNDSQGRVHATWCVVGSIGGYAWDALCSSANAGGTLMGATAYRTPKGPNVSFNSYGDLYVDDNGVMHRAMGGWSNALSKMCIDHSKKIPGGSFSAPTRASLDFLNLSGGDPVPVVIAGENGGVVVAWAEYGASGAKAVKASFYDPGTKKWTIYTIDPAAGFSTTANAYRVALARTATYAYGIWKGGHGHMMLFVVPTSGASLSLTSPNGGESWQAGETHDITWNAIDLTGTASIALYKAGVKAVDIGTADVTAKTFSWAIPRSTAAGTDYRARITVGATVDESDADFTILEANTPRIEVSPAALKFGASALGASTQPQKVLLIDGKGGRLHWSATPSASWLTVSPTSGTGDGYVTIGVNPTGLNAGTYTGTVSITDPDASNTPQEIAVTLEVHTTTSGPIGWFDAPADKAKVMGMVSLDGWALDDLGVERLEIRRDPVAGDLAGNIGRDGLVYIGTAAFIEGSRPDVETIYANYPLNRRGGWGLMMMTYGLPNQGNGTFVIHAVAVDREGNAAEIGRKTLIVSNKYNTKPFGAVDTPAWGVTISGTAYADKGWMLTPRPKIIATTGKTIWVWIDGVKRAHPAYNQYRADIALEFPTLRNKGGAGGTYTFDTTKYANGLHTIKWVATDSAGAVGNTGTSYFRVLNTPSGTVLTSSSGVTMKSEADGTAACGRLSDIAGIPQDYKTPVFRKTGFGDEESFEPAFPDFQGVFEAVMEKDGLVEVRLGVSGSVKGYMVVGDELRPLPVGATLNPVDGTFSWMPGPGFLGRYDLVFVGQTADGFAVKRRVAIRIVPAQFAE